MIRPTRKPDKGRPLGTNRPSGTSHAGATARRADWQCYRPGGATPSPPAPPSGPGHPTLSPIDHEPEREPVPADPLPPRSPKPWWVHWACCTLAIFLVVLPFSLRHLSVGFGIAVFLGAALMPFTQRIEARNLADRE